MFIYFLWPIFFLSLIKNGDMLSINFHNNEYTVLPKFWKNSGFSPAAPLPINNLYITQQLLSNDVYMNMELIAALPNHGVQNLRVHWLLSLIKFK